MAWAWNVGVAGREQAGDFGNRGPSDMDRLVEVRVEVDRVPAFGEHD